MSTSSDGSRQRSLRPRARPAVTGPRRLPGVARGERGYNLIELLMSMSMATVLFMAVVALFVRQSEVLQGQNERLEMNREARFALDHLKRDLGSLGSNSTPSSEADPLVCPKPATPLRSLTVSIADGFVAAPDLNPYVRPVALTLFGTLDVKQRFRTASIEGAKVYLFDDGKLPTTQAGFDEIFSQDRYLRISGADGNMMFFAIAQSNLGDASVTVTEAIPRIGAGQVCGYQGFGQNYSVDVQNFVRYRVVADTRPGAPNGKGGAERGLLVRERMATDGTTLISQVVLAENTVDLGLADVLLDTDPDPARVKPKMFQVIDHVVLKDGSGVLGTGNDARPEQLRFLTIKLAVRTGWPDRALVHRPRIGSFTPLDTWLLSDDGRGAHAVLVVASRVALPTLVSRNL